MGSVKPGSPGAAHLRSGATFPGPYRGSRSSLSMPTTSAAKADADNPVDYVHMVYRDMNRNYAGGIGDRSPPAGGMRGTRRRSFRAAVPAPAVPARHDAMVRYRPAASPAPRRPRGQKSSGVPLR